MPTLNTRVLITILFAAGIQQILALPKPGGDDFPAPHISPGDDSDHPIVRDLVCGRSNAPGVQELLDADCYAHLCQQQPLVMHRWDGAATNRGVTAGNGISRAGGIFKSDALAKFGTTVPDSSDDKVHYDSPEEWPPASSVEGGKPATLIPVSLQAQQAQGGFLRGFYASDPPVSTQAGADGTSKGAWFRFSSFNGATGPYCTALNDLLKDYSAKFDVPGSSKLLESAVPKICKEHNIDLKGLAYDVAHYAYHIDPHDSSKYVFAGKSVIEDNRKIGTPGKNLAAAKAEWRYRHLQESHG